jgi:hypothetical protein
MAQSQPAPKPPVRVIQPFWGLAHDWKNNLQRLVRRRGWPYVVAWAHSIAGVLLVVYAGAHTLTLSALHQPERFTAQMRFFGFFLFVIPEVSRFFKRYVNLDPQKDLCPVRPSNHYHMGGICPKEIDVAHFIALAKAGRMMPKGKQALQL